MGGTAFCCTAHPVPSLDSLEALGWVAKNMLEGWRIEVKSFFGDFGDRQWLAAGYCHKPRLNFNVFAATEVEARAKLLLAILKANAGVKP